MTERLEEGTTSPCTWAPEYALEVAKQAAD